MKCWILTAAVALVTASPCWARLGEPLDTKRIADVSGKRADLPNVEMKIVEFPNLQHSTSNVTRQRRGIRTVPMNTVDAPLVEMPLVGTQTRSMPAANFGPKNQAATHKRVETSTVTTETLPSGKAPISDRVIKPTTTVGEQELINELQRRK